jgi:hypothetical protein
MNIPEVLVDTPVDHIVLESNRDVTEITKKQKETAAKIWRTMTSIALLVCLLVLGGLVLAKIFLSTIDIARR